MKYKQYYSFRFEVNHSSWNWDYNLMFGKDIVFSFSSSVDKSCWMKGVKFIENTLNSGRKIAISNVPGNNEFVRVFIKCDNLYCNYILVKGGINPKYLRNFKVQK